MTRTVIASLGRIADFDQHPYEVAPVDHNDWQTGDYVLGEVTGTPTELYHIEGCDGTMIPVLPGTRVLGALGVRAATLEGVGSWREVQGGQMHALTSAGLFGVFTSFSELLPDPMSLKYLGHACRGGEPLRMRDFAIQHEGPAYATPTIMIIGTSMSAGKTVTGALVCQVLAEAGQKVVGAKITGAGRFRDILSFRDHGAFEVYDFVDGGLPSTVVDEATFLEATRPLLRFIASRGPDYAVIEAGASPLEPYNGAAAVEELKPHLKCRILCASDPYAAVGVQEAFGFKPDLVTGPATNTTAAIDLVQKLLGVPAINVLDPEAPDAVRQFLSQQLGLTLRSGS